MTYIKNIRAPVYDPKREYKPWGWYEVLIDDDNYKVKRLCINIGGRLSLQRHQMRNEHWTIIQGIGEMTLGLGKFKIETQRYVHIPVGLLHRISNTGTEPLIIIEVQTGTYFGEDDIERFSDDYGRAQ
jgi:mannose-6-phosphate isomerase-like protein (cupin superfamily)